MRSGGGDRCEHLNGRGEGGSICVNGIPEWSMIGRWKIRVWSSLNRQAVEEGRVKHQQWDGGQVTSLYVRNGETQTETEKNAWREDWFFRSAIYIQQYA